MHHDRTQAYPDRQFGRRDPAQGSAGAAEAGEGRHGVRHRRGQRRDADAVRPGAGPSSWSSAASSCASTATPSISWRSDELALDRPARPSSCCTTRACPSMAARSGLRDEGLLESALARPLNLAALRRARRRGPGRRLWRGLGKEPSLRRWQQARGLPGGGPVPGAQRPAARRRRQADATLTMLAVAAGQMDEATFARWLRDHSRPR